MEIARDGKKKKMRVPLKHWTCESCNTLQVVETHESNSVDKGIEDQFLQTFLLAERRNSVVKYQSFNEKHNRKQDKHTVPVVVRESKKERECM